VTWKICGTRHCRSRAWEEEGTVRSRLRCLNKCCLQVVDCLSRWKGYIISSDAEIAVIHTIVAVADADVAAQ